MSDFANLQIRVDALEVKAAEKELTKLNKTANNSEKSAKKASSGFSSMTSALKLLSASMVGIAAIQMFKKTISNTIAQENAIKQLETRLKSTNNAVGLSSIELQKFASSMQDVTTYGDEATLAMQGILLTFKDIKGDNFKRTTEAVMDLSAAMGTDLKSSAIQLGKALNAPTQNMSALTRSGIQFTDSQKDLIKQLEKTGDLEQAQTLILKELESQFGGAARAARDTLGGALESLSNTWNDLFEVSDTTAFATTINDANKLLKSFGENLGPAVTGLLSVLDPLIWSIGQMIDGFMLAPGAISAVIAGMVAYKVSVYLATAANVAFGASFTAMQKSMVIFAAFSGGWAFGTYLKEQFIEVELAGIAMVRGVLNAGHEVEKGFKVIWANIVFLKDVVAKMSVNVALDKLKKSVSEAESELKKSKDTTNKLTGEMADFAIKSRLASDGVDNNSDSLSNNTDKIEDNNSKNLKALALLDKSILSTDKAYAINKKYSTEIEILRGALGSNKEINDQLIDQMIVLDGLRQGELDKLAKSTPAYKAQQKVIEEYRKELKILDKLEEEEIANKNKLKLAGMDLVESMEERLRLLKFTGKELAIETNLSQAHARGIYDQDEAIRKLTSDIYLLEKSTKKTKTEFEKMWDAFGDGFEKNLGSYFKDVLSSSEDAWGNFTNRIKDMFFDMLADMAAKLAMSSILKFFSDVGGGLTGLFGSAVSGIASMFGGSSSSDAASVAVDYTTEAISTVVTAGISKYFGGSGSLSVDAYNYLFGSSESINGMTSFMASGASSQQAMMLELQTAEFADGVGLTTDAFSALSNDSSTMFESVSSFFDSFEIFNGANEIFSNVSTAFNSVYVGIVDAVNYAGTALSSAMAVVTTGIQAAGFATSAAISGAINAIGGAGTATAGGVYAAFKAISGYLSVAGAVLQVAMTAYASYMKADAKEITLATTNQSATNPEWGAIKDQDIVGKVIESIFGNVSVDSRRDAFEESEWYDAYIETLETRLNNMDSALAITVGEKVSDFIAEGMKGVTISDLNLDSFDMESFLLQRYEQIAILAGDTFIEGYELAVGKLGIGGLNPTGSYKDYDGESGVSIYNASSSNTWKDSGSSTFDVEYGTTEKAVAGMLLFEASSEKVQKAIYSLNTTYDEHISIMGYFLTASEESQQNFADLAAGVVGVSTSLKLGSGDLTDELGHMEQVYNDSLNTYTDHVNSFEGITQDWIDSIHPNTLNIADSGIITDGDQATIANFDERVTGFQTTLKDVVLNFIELRTVLASSGIAVEDFSDVNYELYNDLKVWAGGIEGLKDKIIDLYSINGLLDRFGISMFDLSIAGIKAASDFAGASQQFNEAGELVASGIDSLSNKLLGFMDLFGTDAEKLGMITDAYGGSIASLNADFGTAMSTSVADYESLIRGFDPNSMPGDLFDKLLDIAPLAKAAIDSQAAAEKALSDVRISSQAILDDILGVTDVDRAKYTIKELSDDYKINLDYTEENVKALKEYSTTLDASNPDNYGLIEDIGKLSNAWDTMGDAAVTTSNAVSNATSSLIAQMARFDAQKATEYQVAVASEYTSGVNQILSNNGVNWQVDMSSAEAFEDSMNTLTVAIKEGGTHGGIDFSDANTISIATGIVADGLSILDDYNTYYDASQTADNSTTVTTQQDAIDKLVSDGISLTESVRTDLEVYKDTMSEYFSLFTSGYISLETYNKAVDKATESYDESLINDLGQTINTLISEFEAFIDSVKSLRQSIADDITRISGAETNYQGKIDAARTGLSTAGTAEDVAIYDEIRGLIVERYDYEAGLIEDKKTELEDLYSVFSNIADYIDSIQLSNVSPLTNAERLEEAKSQYDAMLALTKSSDTDLRDKGLAGITGASDAYLTEARDYFASSQQYQDVWNSVNDSLGFLVSGKTDYSAYELEKESLDNELIDLQDEAKGYLLSLDDEITGLQASLTLDFVTQTDALREQMKGDTTDIVNAIKEVLAINTDPNQNSDITDSGLDPYDSNLDGMVSEIEGAYRDIVGRAGDLPGIGYWESTGLTGDDLLATMAKSANDAFSAMTLDEVNIFTNTYSGDGSVFDPTTGELTQYEGGTDYVPATGNYGLHVGEAVLTANDNAKLSGEIKALRQEVSLLRKDNANQTKALIAANDNNTNKIVTKNKRVVNVR